jgi:F0F1-type ATP synthase membrane subunit c/vacuolar-type H+-ATPase subunit K
MRRGKPLFVHYVAVAVEILLLGYERLAETSLKLMHCVSFGSVWRLYFDGNIVCWQWWQHGLLAFNVIFVVPFVGVLYWGSSKLYNKTISWKEFVGACIVPLPFLICWLVKSLYTRQSRNPTQVRDECTDEISKILHGPFRPPGDKDQGTLYWESVLIGGRLVLLTFRSFIPNSMILFLCMSIACVLMLALHLIKKPFRDSAADKLGTLSLGALACIAIMNLTAATLTSSAVKPEGPNKHIMVVLRWIIVAVLCFFPMVIALLFLFALFSQLIRFGLFLKRQIYIRFTVLRLDYEYLDDSTAFLTD